MTDRNEREAFRALIDCLLDTYTPEGVVVWLNSENRKLGGTPRQLVAAGAWARLFAEADRLAGGEPMAYGHGPWTEELRQPCTCSHPRGDHFRHSGQCLHSTAEETWACDCDRFTVVLDANCGDPYSGIGCVDPGCTHRPPWPAQPDLWDDKVTVCPEHLRFVPCRRCEPGHERYSTNPEDIRRSREFQSSKEEA